MASRLIRQKHGMVDFYIDNFKSDGCNILTVDEAKNKDIEKDVILICSTNIKYYDEIRNNIYDERILSDIQYFSNVINEAEDDECR